MDYGQNLTRFQRFENLSPERYDRRRSCFVPPAHTEMTSMVRIISALLLAVTVGCATAGEPVALVSNPPDRHIVVPGDTLWGIAGKFVRDPWRWPDIWRMNKGQIRNPHRIYPGDIVLLDFSTGSPRLSIAKPLRLQPREYSTPVNQEIPSIPPNVIEPFISRPLLVDPEIEKEAAVVVATQEDRVFLGVGDVAFAAGIPDASQENWDLYRPGKPLIDPDTNQVIAHEAFFLGSAQLLRPGESAALRITQAKQEIGRGDRLLPAKPPAILAYVPHRPEAEIQGRVMSIYGGVNEAGRYSVVSINRGSNDGLEIGHVLSFHRKRMSAGYDAEDRRIETLVPEERYALAFVFRVFGKVSYALVMETTRPVIIGDAVRNP